MKDADQIAVREALRPLDDERAPDLWDEIQGRREVREPSPQPIAGSRLRPVLVAAAIVVAMAFTAVALRLGDTSDGGGRVSSAIPGRPWAVTDRIQVPDLGSSPRLVAAAAGWTVVGTRGGQAIAIVPEGDTLVESTVAVPATAAVAADGEHAWLLDTDGTLHRVSRDGDVDVVARLGRTTSGLQPQVAIGGGAVFVSGTDAGSLVSVDRDDRTVRAVDLAGVPALVAGSDRALWAVLTGGRQIVRIDTDSLSVVDRIDTEPITEIAAAGDRLWIVHGDTATVELVDGGGAPRTLATVSPSVSGLAIAGDRLWVNDDGVLTALDPATGAMLQQLSAGSVGDQAMATTTHALWVIGPAVELIRVGPS